MGRATDPMAVVDSECRVIGVDGLRVCDASIFPEIPSYNTSRPSYLVGEVLGELLTARKWERVPWAVRAEPATALRRDDDYERPRALNRCIEISEAGIGANRLEVGHPRMEDPPATRPALPRLQHRTPSPLHGRRVPSRTRPARREARTSRSRRASSSVVDGTRLLESTDFRIRRNNPHRRPSCCWRLRPERLQHRERLVVLPIPVMRDGQFPASDKRLRILFHGRLRVGRGPAQRGPSCHTQTTRPSPT